MRTKLLFMLILAAAGLDGAQNPLEETLRKAVVQEETNQNLDAAIQGYQAVLAQFEEERKTAATALFRLAETYRKQGKNEQAIAAYQRLVTEFPEQTKLAEQSRKVLAETFNIKPPAAAASASERDRAVAELEAAYAKRRRELDEQRARTVESKAEEARRRYRTLLETEIKMIEELVSHLQQEWNLGVIRKEEVVKMQLQLFQLQRELAAFDAGMPQPATPAQPRQ